MPRETRPRQQKCACPAKPKPASRLAPVLAITTDGEADRLWRHCLVGTSSCVAMIEQYADLGMRKMPIQKIEALRDWLTKIVENYVPGSES